MTKITNISLEFSCPEKLNDKLYCEKCSHHIIDFTTKSAEELEEQINKSIKPVCGIFKASQLSQQFLKYATTTFIAASIAIPSPARQKSKRLHKEKNKREINTTKFEAVYMGDFVLRQAEPVGGYDFMNHTIMGLLKFPEGLTEKGTSYVEFTVDIDGQMKDVKLNKGFNKQADEEAVRALSSMNIPFKPARKKGGPIESKLIFAVVFESTEKRKNKKKKRITE